MAGLRPTYPPRPRQPQSWQNYSTNSGGNHQYGSSGNARATYHHPRPQSNNGMQGYQNSSPAVLSNRFYVPPPPPPRPPAPPAPISFIKSTYSEPPLPPGISEPPSISGAATGRSSTSGFAPPPPPPPSGPIMNPDGTFAPLNLPPLPPIFPYLSPQLAQSLHDGATQCGTSFVDESSDLSFIPVIIDDNDLKKMTQSVKTQFEETRQQNLLLYEDIIDPTWPKELRDMFQPLYCKLCKLTLSSPVVARDHYKGRRHIRAGEMWMQEHPDKSFYRKPQNNTSQGPISGTIGPAGGSFSSHQQSFRGNNNGPPASFYQNQNGFDRFPAQQPNSNSNQTSSLKRNAGEWGGRSIDQNPEFIPAYRAALAGGPSRKRPRKEGGGGPNFAYCGLCNVHHTSAVTAEQHYAGKNHKAKLELAANQNGEPNSNQSAEQKSIQPFSDDQCYGNFASSRHAERPNTGDGR